MCEPSVTLGMQPGLSTQNSLPVALNSTGQIPSLVVEVHLFLLECHALLQVTELAHASSKRLIISTVWHEILVGVISGGFAVFHFFFPRLVGFNLAD